MKRAIIIAAEGIQDVELIYPFYRLQEAGFETYVAAPNGFDFDGIKGVPFHATASIGQQLVHSMSMSHLHRLYDLLILPGGVKAMEKLLLLPEVTRYIKKHHEAGKVIGAMCSGTLLLIEAGLCEGRQMSCYYAWKTMLENAGATFIDAPAVTDGRIVTSPHYKHLGPWMAEVLAEFERVNHA